MGDERGQDGSGTGRVRRLDLVAALAATGATAVIVAGVLAGGAPVLAVLLLGSAGFAAATRARIEEPGGLQLTADLQEAAVVSSALLLTAPEVFVIAGVGNAVSQLRRHDDVRVAAVSWALPLAGVLPATVVVDLLASPEPGASWLVAGLVGAFIHGVVSWAAVRTALSFVHGRPPTDDGLRDLLFVSALGIPAGCAGVVVAGAVESGAWAWLPVIIVGAAALAGTRLASDARLRMQYGGTLTHLHALADVSTDEASFLERAGGVLADAIGCYVTTIEGQPRPNAALQVPLRHGRHVTATQVVRAAPLRRADRKLLTEAAALITRALDDLEHRQAMHRVATTDPLTGLGNRRLLADAVGRMGGAGWGVILIDLDNLKAVNDTLGHQAGDVLLCDVAGVLRSATRGGDVAARLGGDEFAVLTSDPGAVHLMAARLAAAFSSLPAPAELHVGASLGAAVAPHDGESLDAVLEVADRRMYLDKRSVRRPVGYSRSS